MVGKVGVCVAGVGVMPNVFNVITKANPKTLVANKNQRKMRAMSYGYNHRRRMGYVNNNEPQRTERWWWWKGNNQRGQNTTQQPATTMSKRPGQRVREGMCRGEAPWQNRYGGWRYRWWVASKRSGHVQMPARQRQSASAVRVQCGKVVGVGRNVNNWSRRWAAEGR